MFTVEQVKTEFQANRGRLLNLSDVEISEQLDLMEPGSDLDDVFAALMDMEPSSGDTTDVIGSIHIASLASTLARELDADVEFDKHTRAALEAYEVIKRAPVVMLWDFKRVFGDEKVSQFPIPGSFIKDGVLLDADERPISQGNVQRKPDKYKVSVKVNDAETKDQPRSFYKELALDTKQGRQIVEILDQLTLANDKTTRTNAKEPYRSMSATKRLSETNKWKVRKSRLPNLAKQAMQCYFQYETISNMDKVLVGYNSTTHMVDNVEHVDLDEVNTPYWIQDKNNPANVDTYTVSEFLRLDPLQANLNGGTYDALIATIARAPKKPTTTLPEIKTPEELTTHWAVEAAFMDQRHSDWRKRETAIIAALRADPHAIRSFGNVQMATDGVWKVIQPLYDALIQEDIRAEANERKEKAKKLAEKHNEQVKANQQPKTNLANLMK